jgi:hypothetical protein
MGGALGPRGPPRWAGDPRAVRGPFWPVLARFLVVFALFGSFSPCPSPRHHTELQFLRRVHLDARMKAGFPRDLGCSFSHDLVRHIRHAWCVTRHPPANPSSQPPTHPSIHPSTHTLPRSPGLGLSAGRPAEPLRLSSGAWANCWFSALAPGRTAVSAPRAPSARGVGLSAGRPAEPLRLSSGAWANCWFSALAPGRTAVSAPRAPSARGLGLSSTDRLAELLVLSPGARANHCFRPPGGVGPGDLACPRTPCRAAATPGRTAGFQPCRLGELPRAHIGHA